MITTYKMCCYSCTAHLIWSVSLQVHCGGVQSQDGEALVFPSGDDMVAVGLLMCARHEDV